MSDSSDIPHLSWHKHRRILTKEESIQLETDFQHAFGDPASARVLKKILSDLCFFRRCETEEEIVRPVKPISVRPYRLPETEVNK